MTKYLEQIFPIKCKGRDFQGREVLDDAVEVKVNIHQNPHSDTISSTVECQYNTGGGGRRCNASCPISKEFKDTAPCPYTVELPLNPEKTPIGVTNTTIHLHGGRPTFNLY